MATAGFSDLYRAHRGFVRSCLQRCRLPEPDLDDAVQDVFVAMLGRAGDSYDRARQVRPWLFGISRNVARSTRRREGRRARLGVKATPFAAPVPSPEDEVARGEASTILQEFLGRLDADRLAPFILVDLEGRPAKEVAAELGLPVTTVRWRVRSARAELEALAAERSPNRTAALVVWLWPWNSARLLPKLVWLLAVATVGVWFVARTSRGSTGTVAAPATIVTASGDADLAKSVESGDPTFAPLVFGGGGATFVGRVTDDAGDPIAGATVCARMDESDRDEPDDVDPKCAQSERDGTYRLGRIRPGVQRVAASAPGFIPADHATAAGAGRLQADAGVEVRDVDIVLSPGGEKVTGTVLDETGGVVPGAVVSAKDFRKFAEQWTATTVADDEGRFELWTPPGHVSIVAGAGGYAPSSRSAIAPQSEVQLRLMPAVVLHGVVVDPGGQPMPGLRVRAHTAGPHENDIYAFATTDAQGRFSLSRLRPGKYRPNAVGEHWYGEAAEPVLLAFGGDAPPVTIEVVRAGTVLVDVDAPDSVGGCEGEFVGVYGDTDRDARIAGTTATLVGVPPGHYRLSGHCHGLYVSTTIDVGDDEVTHATLRFEPAAVVRARLVGPRMLTQFVKVRPRPVGRTTKLWTKLQRFATVSTDGDGNLTIALATAGSFELVVRSASPPLTVARFEIADGEDRDLGDLPLPPRGAIAGRVVDEDGEALSNVVVDGQGCLGVSTRADGSFELRDLPPGEYTLRPRLRFFELNEPTTVTVEAERTTTIELHGPKLDAEVRGVVRDLDGEPVPDALVQVRIVTDRLPVDGGFRTVKRVRTDTDGAFVQGGLVPGDYEIEVQAEAVVGVDGDACVGDAEVTLVGGTPGEVAVVCG